MKGRSRREFIQEMKRHGVPTDPISVKFARECRDIPVPWKLIRLEAERTIRSTERWFRKRVEFSRRVEEEQQKEAAERDDRARRILDGHKRLGRNQRAWLREMGRNGGCWLFDPAARGNSRGLRLSESLMRLGMVSGTWLGYGKWRYELTRDGRKYLRRFARHR